jgi:homoaconitase/3-isopropylmalate dehydratase large subunit
MVTWGTSPEEAVPITARVPDPSGVGDSQKRAQLHRALHYMGLTPGTPLTDVSVDRVFIGSCTNGDVGAPASAAHRPPTAISSGGRDPACARICSAR